LVIKPANIMVSLKDRNRVTAKIIDLGLSKAVTESPSQPAISMPGAFAGTTEFASPEQFAGIGADIRTSRTNGLLSSRICNGAFPVSLPLFDPGLKANPVPAIPPSKSAPNPGRLIDFFTINSFVSFMKTFDQPN
jgi:serine/threonine protein kinase